jgi:hypothetical protein
MVRARKPAVLIRYEVAVCEFTECRVEVEALPGRIFDTEIARRTGYSIGAVRSVWNRLVREPVAIPLHRHISEAFDDR